MLVHEQIEESHTLRLMYDATIDTRIPGTPGELRAIGAAGYLHVEEITVGLPERRRPALETTFTKRGTDYVRWRRMSASRRFISEYLTPSPEDVRRVGYSPQIAVLLIGAGAGLLFLAQRIWPVLQDILQQLPQLKP